jgi:X-X-X-Leu-X-X-Gly heptad repeat protein
VLLNPDEKTNSGTQSLFSGTQSLFSGVGTFFVELR